MVTPAVDTERGTAAPGPDAPDDTRDGDVPGAPTRAPGRGRTVRRVVAVVLLLLLVAVVWLGVRGLQVVQSLRSAAPEVAAVHAALATADVDAASAHLPALQEHAGAALAGTRDPVWRAASSLPWLGSQLRAVADVTAALDLTATDVVPAVAELADVVRPDALAPVDGVVPLAPLVAARPTLSAAADAAARARDLVVGVETAGLLAPIAQAVDDARGPLGEAATVLERADQAATLVPPMLGADGPRRYLVLVLNPAELRSGGGIVGSVAVLDADAGRLALGDRLASRTLPNAGDIDPALGPDEVAVHGDRLGSIMQNVTMTPDFPRAAELAVQHWQGAGGAPVDGVLAVEPVALSYLLGVTGPVTAPDGTVLDADGAVRALLHDAYVRYPEQDATDTFFADAAASVFAAMVTAPGDAPGLVQAFGRSVGERRIALWSTHADEQEVLAGTPIGGAFFGDAAADQAGVFLDDGTGTKLDYFLDMDVTVSCADPVPGQGVRAVLVVDLTSRVPADVTALPPYMATDERGEPSLGVMHTNLTFYSPAGGRVTEIRGDGTAVGARRATEAGRDAAVLTSTLAPGGTARYEAVVELPDGRSTLGAWRTPGLEGAGTVAPTTCES